MSQQFLYHVTPRTNLVAIRREGLIPTTHQCPDDKDYSGVAAYFTLEDAAEAIRKVKQIRWSDHALVILQIEVSGFEILPLKKDELVVLTEKMIDQERVSVSCVIQCKRLTRACTVVDDDYYDVRV